MRVLILVDCYYPSVKSSAKLVHDLAVELSRRAHEPIVLTPSDAISDDFQPSSEDGVSVVRVKTGQIKGAGKIGRGLREARLSAVLWTGAEKFLRSHPCDLILFYSPTIFFGPLVRRLKELWRCPAYLVLRDIFPDWAVEAGVLRKGLIYRYLRRVATQQYRAADVIAVQSPANLTHFSRTYPREKFRLEVLLNWAALKEKTLSPTNYRARLGIEGKTVFLYGGNIGIAQDMNNLLRLAARLQNRPDIHFLLVGDGSEVPRLKKSVARDGRSNIHVLSGLPQEEYLSMVSECDVGLISLDVRLSSHNIPGKLLSYLYWGLPVLASVNPGNDLFEILHDSGAGFCIRNGDDENLYSSALQLTDNASLRCSMSRSARKLLDHRFSVGNAIETIFRQLESYGLISVPCVKADARVATPPACYLEIPERL
ncbi:MAG: glycosyltransferase family 4 protein [Candidatus Acidiferrales bacterium]